MLRGLKKRIRNIGAAAAAGGVPPAAVSHEASADLDNVLAPTTNSSATATGPEAAANESPSTDPTTTEATPLSTANFSSSTPPGVVLTDSGTSCSAPATAAKTTFKGPNKPLTKRQSRKNNSNNQDKHDDWVVTGATGTAAAGTVEHVNHLSNFDKCIETSDAMTANSSAGQSDNTVLAVRRDLVTGLPDCSLLVSPDGHLLLMPPSGERPEDLFRNWRQNHHSTPATSNNKTTTASKATAMNSPSSSSTNLHHEHEHSDNHQDDHDEEDDDVGLNELTVSSPTAKASSTTSTSTTSFSSSSFSELMLHCRDDYESAVFIGHDLHSAGDRALNRFSFKGWSIPATTLALQQTGHCLTALANFGEELILARKETAARITMACDNLRREAASRHYSLTMPSDQWEILDPKMTEFGLGPQRVGPFQAEDSTLRRALHALEHYHHSTAEKESKRWRAASLQKMNAGNILFSNNTRNSTNSGSGVLPAIHQATEQFRERSTRRQQALEEVSQRASAMEEQLRKLKRESEKRWEAVYRGEARVTKRWEEHMAERSKERQRMRLDKLRAEESQRRAAAATATAAAAATEDKSPIDEGAVIHSQQSNNMSEEVWNLVSSVADSMEHGSFEPMPLESTASVVSDDASAASSNQNYDANHPHSESVLPLLSREDIELEIGLPELRAAAMHADEEIQDAADALLHVLSTLDTTRRSARIAAETCLISAANAQADCLRSLLKLEREALEERLRDLECLEEIVERIDVRTDVDDYIAMDKKATGGSSHLGDDDDGGIASALAILSSHVDGSNNSSMGNDSSSSSEQRRRFSEQLSKNDDTSSSPSKLNEAVDQLFDQNAFLEVVADESDEASKEGRAAFDATVDFLCKAAVGESSRAKTRRSTLCYALNSKRSNAKIETKVQFDALCKVFSAILDGCSGEHGVSSAKMMMMLSQTFYTENLPLPGTGEAQFDDSTRQQRQRRIYVKNQLLGHPIWKKDDFWDVALSQQISESLTHSGVLSNFDRNTRVQSTEWTQTRRPRWHDLTYMERSEAASQVHAVVFAQLGALAHSMIEFGCGLERSCAFVRRMAIRNQLPSSQRTMLLTHLMARDDVGRQETTLS